MRQSATETPSSTPPPPAGALEAAARHHKLLSGINVAMVAIRTARVRLLEEAAVDIDCSAAEENARDEVADATAHLTDAIEGLAAAKARAESLLALPPVLR